MTDATREARASAAFVALVDGLVTGFDVVDHARTLLAACVDLLDVDAGTLLLADASGELRPIASTTEGAGRLEVVRPGPDAGPCRRASTSGAPVVLADLSAETGPWPGFRSAALAAGYRSCHAIPLHLRGRTLGVLGLVRAEAGALSERDVVLARALADVATIAILHDRDARAARDLAGGLQRALDGRIVIEQAKGVLAQRLDLDMAGASAVLHEQARTTGRPLQHVAAEVVGRRTLVEPRDDAAAPADGGPASG